MVQSVALKRPRGGVRGWLFHVPGPSLIPVQGALYFPCPVATAAPEPQLHCLRLALAGLQALPRERPGWLYWAVP